MMSGRSCSSGSSRYHPFTPSQWQELEHQALIYKYMVSGIPIPSDLILPLRRSFLLDATSMTSPSLAFPPQPSMSWGCFQLGFGRKAEDPEPGRCRRTDGKKWRCSKEAYPDSKYCERHMHRGKNRSRKPVEMSLTNALSSNTNNAAATQQTPSLPLSISTPEPTYHHPQQQHFMYSYSSSSKPQQHSPSYFSLDPNTTTPFSSADRDYRYLYHGMKDHVDGYSFLSEGVRPLGLNSYGEKEQHGMSSAVQQNTYSHCNVGGLGRDENEEKQQHCFVLGADFKLDRPTKHDDHKPLRHFFDEWPQKSKDSWVDSEGDHGSLDSYSKTQLSISIPMAHHDFPIISSRYTTD